MPTVMVVDDAPMARTVVCRLLQREGYRTMTVDSGRNALHALEEAVPDLILLDVIMPELDGLELLEILHAHPQWRALPVVMMTSVSDTHTIHRAEQLGAKEFLIKAAFSVSEMLSTVKKYTEYMPQ